MSLNLNKIMIAGRITADPEIKMTQSGIPVCSFNVAINRPKGKNGEDNGADFVPVTAWRTTAEFVGRYFHKGMAIFVSGALHVGQYTDQNGNKRTTYNVNADSVDFVENKAQGDERRGDMSPADDKAAPPPPPKFETVNDDDDLPF